MDNSPRRRFLKQLMAGTMSVVTLPAVSSSSKFEFGPPPANENDEVYWEWIKKQFAVPSNLTMMNAANLCPAPYLINESVQASLRGLGRDVSFQFRDAFAAKRKKAIAMLAEYIGASVNEVGITRNTSESNNIIVNGLDLKSGDEIILWDQNHPSNNIAWENRAKREGFLVKKVSVPANPASADDLLSPFVKAITSKTRLIGFSHISNTSGIAIPAKQLCAIATEKKILTLVDGAQSFGSMNVNLHDLGCDFYTGSTHKWLMGPLESGILYIKEQNISRVWPNIISAGWKDTGVTVDEKFCVLGQRNDSSVAGLPETLEFHLSIGKKKIEDRVKQLNAYLKNQIKSNIQQATVSTPWSPELSGGIVVSEIAGKKAADVFQKLYENHGIAGAAVGGIRLSPHIYNTLADVDKVVDALTELSK